LLSVAICFIQLSKGSKTLQRFILLTIAIILIISSDSTGFPFRPPLMCNEQRRHINNQHIRNIKGNVVVKKQVYEMYVQSSKHRIQTFFDIYPEVTPEILVSQEQNCVSY
jgi:hypothetical protein